MKTNVMRLVNYFVEQIKKHGNISISMLNYNLTEKDVDRVCAAVKARGYTAERRFFLGYVAFGKPPYAECPKNS